MLVSVTGLHAARCLWLLQVIHALGDVGLLWIHPFPVSVMMLASGLVTAAPTSAVFVEHKLLQVKHLVNVT